MQFFFRTSENTGVGVGPLGMLAVAPTYLAAIAVVAAGAVIALLAALIVAAGRAIAARRRRSLHIPDG